MPAAAIIDPVRRIANDQFARQNGAAQGEDIFPATQGKHGKKFVWGPKSSKFIANRSM